MASKKNSKSNRKNNGDRVIISLSRAWSIEGILVEQDDDCITLSTDEGYTVIVPQTAIKALWIKESFEEGKPDDERSES